MQPDATPITAASGPSARGKARLFTLDDLDKRTIAARRARELVESLTHDLGGDERLTQSERQLVQRVATLSAVIEHLEARLARGEPVDMASYLASVNAQRRIIATLGIERRADDQAPNLKTYLSGKTANRESKREAAA